LVSVVVRAGGAGLGFFRCWSVGAVVVADWHIYLDHPDQGPLGYYTGVDEEFDPDAATRALARGGRQIISPWTETLPAAEAPYTAAVIPASSVSS
jgi:hypothetical protein